MFAQNAKHFAVAHFRSIFVLAPVLWATRAASLAIHLPRSCRAAIMDDWAAIAERTFFKISSAHCATASVISMHLAHRTPLRLRCTYGRSIA